MQERGREREGGCRDKGNEEGDFSFLEDFNLRSRRAREESACGSESGTKRETRPPLLDREQMVARTLVRSLCESLLRCKFVSVSV